VDAAPSPAADTPAATHCTGCGQLLDVCGDRCGRRSGPPRFCPRCGRRLVTMYTPGSAELHCRDHGPVA